MAIVAIVKAQVVVAVVLFLGIRYRTWFVAGGPHRACSGWLGAVSVCVCVCMCVYGGSRRRCNKV